MRDHGRSRELDGFLSGNEGYVSWVDHPASSRRSSFPWVGGGRSSWIALRPISTRAKTSKLIEGEIEKRAKGGRRKEEEISESLGDGFERDERGRESVCAYP